MKLTACYTVFNGLELLERSIDQIYSLVDNVIICYQTISNKGNACDKVESFVYYQFKSKKKVVIIKYTPDLAVNTKENERRKHQLLLETAKNIDSTHVFLNATDEFYDKNEFFFAKTATESANFDLTFTKMFTYYKHSNWQLTPIEDYYKPFIIKLYPETKIEVVRNYPLKVDPSVQVNTCKNWYLFSEKDIMMHHYSMIRENIRDKFKNAAASIRWRNNEAELFANEFESYDLTLNPGVKYFQGRKIKVVENYFGI